MRTLGSIPARLIDPLTAAPAWGSYRGALDRIDLAPLSRDPLERLARQKRWVYVAITAGRALIGAAIVDLGYAVSAFAFAYQEGEGMRVDRSLLGAPGLCRVRQTRDHRIDARFVSRRGSLRVAQRDGDPGIEVAIDLPALSLRGTLDGRAAPPALTAIAPIDGGAIDVTEKRVSMPVRGAAMIAGRRIDLDAAGSVGGYDLTLGLLARRTRWRWAFLLGRAVSGERVGLNLVEGFVGELECAAWVDDQLVPLAEGRFTFDRDAVERPWTVRTVDGAVDLVLTPGGVHRETRDLGIVSSRFVQPVGSFSGTIEVLGRRLVIERALGVVEDQDVLW
jgi:hypothetical protein